MNGGIARPATRRIQRRFLLGSRWTSLGPVDDPDQVRHFEAIARADDLVTLRAILDGTTIRVALAALADPARWARGWLSL